MEEATLILKLESDAALAQGPVQRPVAPSPNAPQGVVDDRQPVGQGRPEPFPVSKGQKLPDVTVEVGEPIVNVGEVVVTPEAVQVAKQAAPHGAATGTQQVKRQEDGNIDVTVQSPDVQVPEIDSPIVNLPKQDNDPFEREDPAPVVNVAPPAVTMKTPQHILDEVRDALIATGHKKADAERLVDGVRGSGVGHATTQDALRAAVSKPVPGLGTGIPATNAGGKSGPTRVPAPPAVANTPTRVPAPPAPVPNAQAQSGGPWALESTQQQVLAAIGRSGSGVSPASPAVAPPTPAVPMLKKVPGAIPLHDEEGYRRQANEALAKRERDQRANQVRRQVDPAFDKEVRGKEQAAKIAESRQQGIVMNTAGSAAGGGAGKAIGAVSSGMSAAAGDPSGIASVAIMIAQLYKEAVDGIADANKKVIERMAGAGRDAISQDPDRMMNSLVSGFDSAVDGVVAFVGELKIVGEPIKAFAGSIQAMRNEVQQSAEKFAIWHGGVAVATAEKEIADRQREMNRAGRFGDDFQRLTEQRMGVDSKLATIQDRMTPLYIRFMENTNHLLENILDWVDKGFTTTIKAIQELLELIGNIPGVGNAVGARLAAIQELLRQMLETTEDAGNVPLAELQALARTAAALAAAAVPAGVGAPGGGAFPNFLP